MNPSCGPHFSRQLGLPKHSGAFPHPSAVEWRNKTPPAVAQGKDEIPCSALHPPLDITHPHHLLFASASPMCPKMWGKCPQISLPCLARSPHGSLQAHHAVMGRELTHLMDRGQGWGHHLGGSRPPAAAFEEPFFDRKYNFVTPHPSSKCSNFCSSDPLSI